MHNSLVHLIKEIDFTFVLRVKSNKKFIKYCCIIFVLSFVEYSEEDMFVFIVIIVFLFLIGQI